MRLIDADALQYSDARDMLPTGQYITREEIDKAAEPVVRCNDGRPNAEPCWQSVESVGGVGMRLIDADKLKARLIQTLLDDLVLADVLNIIEELEKDPEDRASEMLDTYARGYNDGVKMTVHLMLKFRDTITDQEEEHER